MPHPCLPLTKAITLSVYLSPILQKENPKTQLGLEIRQWLRGRVLSSTVRFAISLDEDPQGSVGTHPQMCVYCIVPSLCLFYRMSWLPIKGPVVKIISMNFWGHVTECSLLPKTCRLGRSESPLVATTMASAITAASYLLLRFSWNTSEIRSVRALVLMTPLTSFDQISSKSSWLRRPLSCCFL